MICLEFRGSGRKGLSDPPDETTWIRITTLIEDDLKTTPNARLLPAHISWSSFLKELRVFEHLGLRNDFEHTEIGYLLPRQSQQLSYVRIHNEPTFHNALSVLSNVLSLQPTNQPPDTEFKFYVFSPPPKQPLSRLHHATSEHQIRVRRESTGQSLSSAALVVRTRSESSTFNSPKLAASAHPGEPGATMATDNRGNETVGRENGVQIEYHEREDDPIRDFDAHDLMRGESSDLPEPERSTYETGEQYEAAMAEWRDERNRRDQAA